MPTIGAAVSAETKGEFESVARARGTTSSRLAASIIEDFLKREAGKTPSLLPAPEPVLPTLATVAAGPGAEARTKQVFVRLEPYYYDELSRLAAERAWFAGTYLANLFHAHVDRRPVLCNAEIHAVRQVARQLADMGRNINQIARKLNTSMEHAHLVGTVDFEVVKMLIELETNVVKDLMKANVRGWGVSDVEP
jgi:predicted DNA-binding ribbon-helix-helix protein